MTAPKELFLPANRSEWTSLICPPEGYRVDCAIGTTFGLDFTALTALLLAMLDQPSQEAAWEEHARCLQAITALDHRVRVFANRGQIHADLRSSNSVFALLDRIIDDVHLEKGAFHPKVWVVKYVPRRPVDLEFDATRKGREVQNAPVYRLLCTSRNLTLGSNWEAVIRLDGHAAAIGERDVPNMGKEVAAFFSHTGKNKRTLSPELLALIRELPRVTFSTEGSRAIKSCEFFWQWPGKKGLIESVKPNGRVALVVSPFIRAALLKELAGRFRRLLVVSRQEELDAFWNESIEKLVPRTNVWVVKSDAAEEDATEGNTASFLDLHAKLLFCEYGRSGGLPHSEVWLGSANASPRGWGQTGKSDFMNCEAMIRFVPGIHPDQFLEQFAYRSTGSRADIESRVLNGWIEPYIPRNPDLKTEEERFDELLDKVKTTFAALSLVAQLERTEESVVFVLQARERAACKILFTAHPEIGFHAVPFGLAKENADCFADLTGLANGDLRFENIALSEVGTFLLVKLTHRPSSREKLFVLQIEVQVDKGFWDERRAAFLRAHLSPRDFRLFLRSILFNSAMEPGPLVNGDDGRNGKLPHPPGLRVSSLLDDMAVEDILHACTQDRTKIDQVDHLLRTFESTDHVDEPFRAFWANFRQAVRAMDKGQRR